MSCVFGVREDFEVVHCRVRLELDLERRLLSGCTSIVVLAHDLARRAEGQEGVEKTMRLPNHQWLFLNASHQIQVLGVQVEGDEARFQHRDPFNWKGSVLEQDINKALQLEMKEARRGGNSDANAQHNPGEGTEPTFKTMAQYELDFNYRNDIVDEGELKVEIPELIRTRIQQQAESESGIIDPFIISIRFQVENPSGGLHFSENLVCTTATHGSIGSWMPCRDSHWERCTYEVEIICSLDLTALCSGNLKSQSQISEKLQSFKFEITEPILASSVGFAVGRFAVIPRSEVGESGPKILCAWPMDANVEAEHVLHSTSELDTILQTFEAYVQSKYPFRLVIFAFIDLGLPNDGLVYSSLVLLNSSILHSSRIIDQTFDTRTSLAYCLAKSWIIHSVSYRSVADYWIVEGIIRILTQQYIELAFGNNESVFRRQTAYRTVVSRSLWPDSYPLYSEEYAHPVEVYESEFFKLKSWIVSLMLSDKIGDDIFKEFVQSAISDTQATLSTKKFLKLLKHKSALNLDDFRDRWIDGKDCPSFKIVANFVRKKSTCEVSVKQERKSAVVGRIQIYVHETDRQVYEHEARLDDSRTNVEEFPCHSKVRKNRKRTGKQDALEENAIQQVLDDDVLDQSLVKNDTPIRWVRIDPKQEWICKIDFTQLPLWLTLELEHAHELVPQLEAIESLGRFINGNAALASTDWASSSMANAGDLSLLGDADSAITLLALANKTLKDCLENADYFHRVRSAAANQLAGAFLVDETVNVGGDIVHLVSTTVDGIGTRAMELLLRYFKSRYYDPDTQLVRPNDFSDFGEYFVQCEVPSALSKVRTQKNFTPDSIVEFILELLNYNDNSHNMYSDCYYIANLARSLGDLRPSTSDLVDRVWSAVLHLLEYDQDINTSYNRVVTQGCLSAIVKLVDSFGDSEVILNFSKSSDQNNTMDITEYAEYDDVTEEMEVDAKKPVLEDAFISPLNSIHVHPFNFMKYLSSDYPLPLRLHCWRCLVDLSRRHNYVFGILLDILEDITFPVPLRCEMMTILADDFRESGSNAHSPIALYNLPGADNLEFRNRAYALMTSDSAGVDSRFRYAAFRLYLFIWGHKDKLPIVENTLSANTKRRSKYRGEMRTKRETRRRNRSKPKRDTKSEGQSSVSLVITG